MTYLLILIILFVLELLYFKVAEKYNIIDKPNERSSHTKITLRGGGVVFYLGMLLYFLCFGFFYPWFFTGLSLIAAISFMDDARSVSNKTRLLVHFLAMLFMFYDLGLFSGIPYWYILFALIFSTGVINAYNFMDGINGMTGGYSLIVVLSLIYINSMQVHFIDQAFLYVVFISLFVFNIFNFRTKARCFAGDVGAVSIGFILVFALGKLMIETRDMTSIVLLAVYGVDSVMTVLHRLILRENIFKPHRRHVYQLMANELKIPHILVSTVYAFTQMVVFMGYICFFDNRVVYVFTVILVLSVTYVLFKKYFYSINPR